MILERNHLKVIALYLTRLRQQMDRIAGRNWIQSIFAALIIVLVFVIWTNFAPPQFGGLSSYVMIAGASMEPVLKQGDLVLVRDELDYQVGEVVTYQHPLVGPIIHRIIDTEVDRYILQGDNNNWIDSYTPTREEVIGRLWLHVPKAGNIIRTIRSPVAMALLAILISMGFFSKLAGKESRENRPGQNGSRGEIQLPGGSNAELDSYIIFIAVFFISSLILGITAFRKPLSVTVAQEIPYYLSGSFNYTAKAPTGIYDTDSVQTGDPIYLSLTRELSVDFSFRLTTDDLHRVNGSIMMNAFVRDPHGWNRTIVLAPRRSFAGSTVDVSGKVNLSEVMVMIESLEEQTGFSRADYTLVIQPTVVSEAKINNDVQLDEFSPQLTFRLDGQQIYLKSTEIGTTETAQLSPTENRFYIHEHEMANVISILGLDIKVELARWSSVIGVVFSLLGFAFTLLSYSQTARKGEAAIISLRYGGMIVDINKGVRVDNHNLVEVGKIEDLARFAERAGIMILHEYRWKRHVYYVQDGDNLFRYKPKSIQQNAFRQKTKSGTNGNLGTSSKDEELPTDFEHRESERSKVFLLVKRVGEKVMGSIEGYFGGCSSRK